MVCVLNSIQYNPDVPASGYPSILNHSLAFRARILVCYTCAGTTSAPALDPLGYGIVRAMAAVVGNLARSEAPAKHSQARRLITRFVLAPQFLN